LGSVRRDNVIEIEKGIPFQTMFSYQLDKMEIGDSFFIKTDKPNNVFNNSHSSAAMFRKTHPDFRIRGKREATGVRIWRVQ
jgi:hypothetical protein